MRKWICGKCGFEINEPINSLEVANHKCEDQGFGKSSDYDWTYNVEKMKELLKSIAKFPIFNIHGDNEIICFFITPQTQMKGDTHTGVALYVDDIPEQEPVNYRAIKIKSISIGYYTRISERADAKCEFKITFYDYDAYIERQIFDITEAMLFLNKLPVLVNDFRLPKNYNHNESNPFENQWLSSR